MDVLHPQTAAPQLTGLSQPQSIAPQLTEVSQPQTVAPRVLHLRIDATGRLQSLQTLDTLPTTPSQQHLLRTCPQLFTPTQDTAQHVTTLGRVCERDSDGRWFYLQQGVPHFYEFPAEEGELGEEPDCAIDYSAYVSQSGGGVIDSSELERELEASQNALFEATMQNERSLCGLLAAMVAGEAESEATQQLAAESDRLVKELKEYEMVKRPERVKEEEEEDNDAICEVCGDGRQQLRERDHILRRLRRGGPPVLLRPGDAAQGRLVLQRLRGHIGEEAGRARRHARHSEGECGGFRRGDRRGVGHDICSGGGERAVGVERAGPPARAAREGVLLRLRATARAR